MSHNQLKKDTSSDLCSENEENHHLHNTATEPLPWYESSEESGELKNHGATYTGLRKQCLIWNGSEQTDKSAQRRMLFKLVALFESIDGCEMRNSTTRNGS
ncbi:unnamed protein product [Rodentolepis nana]|uniref:Uncharacterized protein n=1 Tax=Rodentolepis nana TaxID=102285 RepID=A0A0R3TJV5_RODNA|nr:unnamed protein product [Rodentolepis nana]